MAQLASILIADDEELFRETTAHLLRNEGYCCDCAPDAPRAMEMISVKRYDVLISDIRMPGNSQLQLVRKAQEVLPGLTTILVTGFPSLAAVAEKARLRVTACLFKPFDFEELLQIVRRRQD